MNISHRFLLMAASFFLFSHVSYAEPSPLQDPIMMASQKAQVAQQLSQQALKVLKQSGPMTRERAQTAISLYAQAGQLFEESGRIFESMGSQGNPADAQQAYAAMKQCLDSINEIKSHVGGV